ncbi:putative dimethylaniline monooxygenase protein [Phaeoacremonium minimum UCRPA7]|uniref:Putative dimethylaniline monooxygenase protein n=1 Tax=Phaeoacremonium minimum (strain UCR-PA7) TaxID=1286976 RepID=R8BGE1_PHAM7|nr:putative dimethylaniline monooxygenase protein [Phaeoacremonium minimum UCRPA7]EON98386.1 putative dimethylaniline monooxygenase protein [Phaeoacremonium minimum UCRPA7]
MTRVTIDDWSDEAIRPRNADSQIGWAGVPLSETLAYYGVIPRPKLPTNDQLGFTPDYASVDVNKLVDQFLPSFAKAVEAQDVDSILGHIYEHGYWKDVELLTWDIRALAGHENIRPMLTERLSKTGIKNIRASPHIPSSLETLGDDLSFVLFHFEFDFAHGTGIGAARLSPFTAKSGSASELADVNSWKLYTIGTAIETVEGWDAENGDKIRYQKAKIHDPLGKARNYQELREDEREGRDGFQPTVVIVGAGHTGLTLAARFKVLGIPHLVIEKEDCAGYSWGSRYGSLSLHGPTFTNHLPCVPFPHWFPVFLPAQQLSKFLQLYAEIMDLNIWTKTHIDGKGAVYDEKEGKWTISVTRGDGSKHVLHPKHIMIATGISGTLPNVPEVPGMTEFEQNGGLIVHSSRHHTGPDWKGKKCIVVGAATSGHDISYELIENGCEVTMIQRSATHVMSVDRSVRTLFKPRENTNRRGGLAADLMDQSNYLKQPFPVEYELLPRGQRKARELDAELLQSLRDVGYRLHDGYHGGGAYSMFMFDQGGFYWDTGCCKLIADKTIALKHSEIDHFTKDGVVYKDGTSQQADVVVFATGYMNSKSAIQALMGDDMARKCNERWEKGNAFFIGPEGESIINYCPLPQKGLYAMFHQFAFSRFHSARLALRIKAEELGIDVTPYGNKPLGPASTAAGRQPRQ